MTTSYLCIDPGLTTGVVILETELDAAARLVMAAEVPGTAGELKMVFEDWWNGSVSARYEGGLTVVIEAWEYRHGVPTDANLACRPIGMFDVFCWEHGTRMIEQVPGFRRSIPDTKAQLKPLGYWIGLEGHARQALRHGLAYLIRTQKHRPTMEHLFPRPQSVASS